MDKTVTWRMKTTRQQSYLRKLLLDKLKVFNIRNKKIERMTSDGKDSDVEPPLIKKQRQNAKKSKMNMKRQKQ